MRHRLAFIVGAGLLLGFIPTAPKAGEAKKHGFLHRSHKDGESESNYTLFVPHGYNGDKTYPLIVFLHGAGERGDDGNASAKVGLGPAIKKYKGGEKSFPFFAIFPQCRPNNNWGAKGADAQTALAILADVQKKYKIDDKCIYLTGLSLGGFGTWSLAAALPEKWAAIAPICGGGNPKAADKIKDIPCWCFHGADDKVVNVKKSREMIDALKAAGGQPKYTEYPGVDHNSWDHAYGNAELYAWLLSHKLK